MVINTGVTVAEVTSQSAETPIGVEDGYTETSGPRIYWTKHSTDPDGVPLLLISGLGSPLVAYEEGFVAELVQRGFSVVRFDNRDVGRSSRIVPGPEDPAAPYTIVDMAADAVAVLDAVGWDDANVLGQSMGGMIAQQVAIDHGNRVRNLISFMSATGERGFGRPTEAAYEGLIKPAPSDPEAWLNHRVETEQLWASPDTWDPAWTRAKGQLLLDHGVDVDGTSRQYRAIVASGSRDEALRAVTVPTLVIHGSADTLIQPDGGRHTADVMANARYLELDGLGHDLPPARWPELAKIVARFVAGVEHPD